MDPQLVRHRLLSEAHRLSGVLKVLSHTMLLSALSGGRTPGGVFLCPSLRPGSQFRQLPGGEAIRIGLGQQLLPQIRARVLQGFLIVVDGFHDIASFRCCPISAAMVEFWREGGEY